MNWFQTLCVWFVIVLLAVICVLGLVKATQCIKWDCNNCQDQPAAAPAKADPPRSCCKEDAESYKPRPAKPHHPQPSPRIVHPRVVHRTYTPEEVYQKLLEDVRKDP